MTLHAVVIAMDASRVPESMVEDLRAVLGEHPGDTPVILSMGMTIGPRRRLLCGPRFNVRASADLSRALESLGLTVEMVEHNFGGDDRAA